MEKSLDNLYIDQEKVIHIASPQPTSLVFCGGGNGYEPLFTIKPDGTIEKGAAFTTQDAASLAFWNAIERYFPEWQKFKC